MGKKLKIELNDDTINDIIIEELSRQFRWLLKDQQKMIELSARSGPLPHFKHEDYEYNEALIPALRKVLSYYGKEV